MFIPASSPEVVPPTKQGHLAARGQVVDGERAVWGTGTSRASNQWRQRPISPIGWDGGIEGGLMKLAALTHVVSAKRPHQTVPKLLHHWLERSQGCLVRFSGLLELSPGLLRLPSRAG